MGEMNAVSNLLAQLISYVPQILLALVLFIIGLLVAKGVKRGVQKLVQTGIASSVLDNTPIDHFLKNADLKHRLDDMLGSLAYWVVLLITLYVVASSLGFYSVVDLLARVFAYVPHFVSAAIVLVLGVLLAGFVEKLSKSALAGYDVKTARLVGKMSSYLVISLTAMIAFSELGIARDFILILFTGLVLAFALSFGLAVGLGGQDTVRQLMQHWMSGKLERPEKSKKK